MAYINRKQTEDAIRKYADQKHSNGEQIEFVNGILKSISVINEQPTADVVEVKHGEWIETIWKLKGWSVNCDGHPVPQYFCSLCQREVYSKEPYCHCGAKMDVAKSATTEMKDT